MQSKIILWRKPAETTACLQLDIILWKASSMQDACSRLLGWGLWSILILSHYYFSKIQNKSESAEAKPVNGLKNTPEVYRDSSDFSFVSFTGTKSRNIFSSFSEVEFRKIQSSLNFLSQIKGIPRKGFLAFCSFSKAETLEPSVGSYLSWQFMLCWGQSRRVSQATEYLHTYFRVGKWCYLSDPSYTVSAQDFRTFIAIRLGYSIRANIVDTAVY